MRFNPADADIQSMKVIELLIESGHYKAFRKEEGIKLIGKDSNTLAYALTEPVKAMKHRFILNSPTKSKRAPSP